MGRESTMDQPIYGTGTIPLDELRRRDGLSLLEAMRAGEIPQAPIYETLGMRVSRVERGRVGVEAYPHRRFYSPVGGMHVGFSSGLLETALIAAVLSMLDAGEQCAPVEFKVNHIRPVLESTGPVEAIGTVLYRGRTVATAEGKLVDAKGKLYAHASATCTISALAEEPKG
jgi:uncharacterized protein (TIGR00369 family)